MGPSKITTSTLLRRHAPLWKVTCRNPFVGGVRDGSLPIEVFDRWIVQHRYLAEKLFSAVCRIAAAAPEADRPLLLGILQRLHVYVSKFDRTLIDRRLVPATPIHPVCRAYVDYTLSLGFEPYTVALLALWTQYRAYLDAWKWAQPGARRFRAVIRGWYSAEREAGLVVLSRAADAALADAPPGEVRRAEEAFLEIAKYELAFWVMTMSASRET